MKKKKLLTALSALGLAVALPLSAFAATFDNVDTEEKLLEAFQYSGTDADIIINLTGDIDLSSNLETLNGKTYTINGKTYVITDVVLTGSGTVNIDADIGNQDNSTALIGAEDVTATVTGDIISTEYGVDAYDNADITVNGNVTTDEDGLYAEDDAKITVNGDVTAGYDGVLASNNADVTVNGNVTADSDGLYAEGDAKITVNGDVTAGDEGIDASGDKGTSSAPGSEPEFTSPEVTVNGDVQGTINADGNAVVSVDGNVSGTSGNPEDVDYDNPEDYSDGDDGVNAEDNAQVSITGDVTGGDAYGTYGYAGNGVDAEDQANVTVGGSITGGSVTADPDVKAYEDEDRVSNSIAGDGVVMDSTATVTAGGNVTGGSTNGDQGVAGAGVMIYMQEQSDPNDPDAEQISSGKLYVEGTISGGKALNATAASGNGLAFSYFDGSMNLDEQILGELLIGDDTDIDNAGDMMNEIMGRFNMLEMLLEVPGSDEESINSALDGVYDNLMKVLGQAIGKDKFETEEDFEALNALTPEQHTAAAQALAESFNNDATEIYNSFLDAILESSVSPVVTTWNVQAGGDDVEAIVCDLSETLSNSLAADVNYIVRIAETKNGKVAVDKETAKPGETVTITATPNDGYELDSILVNGAEIAPKDGKYTFVMPDLGGVEISALFLEKVVIPPAGGNGNSVNTGDNTGSSVALAGALVVLSAGVGVFLLSKKKKSVKEIG